MRPTTDELLDRTSRTFALAIPLLPEPTRATVKLAYLLLRVADTLEDAELWPRQRRVDALQGFARLLVAPTPAHAGVLSHEWLSAGSPTRHEHYLELLDSLPNVIREVAARAPAAREIVLRHARRTTLGMCDLLQEARADGHGRICSVPDLKRYCYVVAGIVGELLTEIFVLDTPALGRVRPALVARERAFGEGLQLVNILKDEDVDAGEGRRYLPPGVPRAEILALARRDMAQAGEYIATLRAGGAPAGCVAFCSLAAQLADATLLLLDRDGAGAKLPRGELLRILSDVMAMSYETAAC